MNFPEVEKPKIPFSGLDFPEKKAKALIFGVQLEETATGKKGTALGPDALRNASAMLETFSLNAKKEYFESNPTLDLGNVKFENLENALEKTESLIKKILTLKKTPVMLGGEHSITLAALRALKKEDFIMLHFDAHPDLRQEFEGKQTSHATFLRKALNEGIMKKENILQFGVRTASKEEFEFLQESKIKCFKARELNNPKAFEKAKETLSEKTKGKNCYVSFDIDVLDSSLVPATGTPEPGGLSYWQAVELLESIKGKVIGLDVVETVPDEQKITETTSAKILYEMLSILTF